MALQWTSTLSVGVAEIDQQHQELFRRIDRLLDSMLRNDRSEAARLLDFLAEYVIVHFADEESLMEGTGYPDLQRHTEDHRRFRATLRDISLAFAERGPTASLVLRLEQEVVGWLKDHVYFTDVALGRFVLAHRASAAARVAC